MRLTKASLSELTLEVDLHQKASELLLTESARLAQAAFGQERSLPLPDLSARCHWDEPHQQRLESLHALRLRITDAMGKSTRVGSLCTAAVAELVEIYRVDHRPVVKQQLVRACGVLERLASIGFHLIATRSRVLDRIAEEEAQAACWALMLEDDDAPVTAAARAELDHLMDRLHLQR